MFASFFYCCWGTQNGEKKNRKEMMIFNIMPGKQRIFEGKYWNFKFRLFRLPIFVGEKQAGKQKLWKTWEREIYFSINLFFLLFIRIFTHRLLHFSLLLLLLFGIFRRSLAGWLIFHLLRSFDGMASVSVSVSVCHSQPVVFESINKDGKTLSEWAAYREKI